MLHEKAFHNWHTDVLEYLSSGVWRVFSHRVFNATNFICKHSGCTRAFVSGGSLATKALKTAYVTQKFPPSRPNLTSSPAPSSGFPTPPLTSRSSFTMAKKRTYLPPQTPKPLNPSQLSLMHRASLREAVAHKGKKSEE
jgi:hypothetical protein